MAEVKEQSCGSTSHMTMIDTVTDWERGVRPHLWSFGTLTHLVGVATLSLQPLKKSALCSRPIAMH